MAFNQVKIMVPVYSSLNKTVQRFETALQLAFGNYYRDLMYANNNPVITYTLYYNWTDSSTWALENDIVLPLKRALNLPPITIIYPDRIKRIGRIENRLAA